jgi:hypothetical protein
LTGLYASHLTLIGIDIPIAGAVHMTLVAAGAAQQTCRLGGEVEPCSDILTVENGTVTGADPASGDAGVSVFPFYCSLSGVLDCQHRELVNGWMQCASCPGAVADGGAACANGANPAERFAGTLTAQYDSTTASFVGAWNAALAGNDGGSPGPDGGPASSYLSDSGTYGSSGAFGGSGTWTAAGP